MVDLELNLEKSLEELQEERQANSEWFKENRAWVLIHYPQGWVAILDRRVLAVHPLHIELVSNVYENLGGSRRVMEVAFRPNTISPLKTDD